MQQGAQQEKTVIEWLEQAKSDGYEWADRAINNTNNSDHYTGRCIATTLSGALSLAFVFVFTPEKDLFRWEVLNQIKSQGL